MANVYECDMCGAAFDSGEELQEHNREEHPGAVEQGKRPTVRVVAV